MALLVYILYGEYRLYMFYQHFVVNTPYVARPDLVDGFLPIGGLLGLKLWIAEGSIHPVHPAAVIILLSALIISLLLKKSFCGWICPIGTLSELAFKAGQKLLGRNFRMNGYADFALRSIKYLLLGLILHLTFIKLDINSTRIFLDTSYWKIADIKMLFFFLDTSRMTFIVLLFFMVLSLVFKNFWCRYICPYGALTGLLSFLSPLKITRNDTLCVQCKKCTQSCPNLIPVQQVKSVNSAKCSSCFTCLSACPSEGALDITDFRKKTIQPVFYILIIFLIFFGIIGGAQIAGHWESRISYDIYQKILPSINLVTH